MMPPRIGAGKRLVQGQIIDRESVRGHSNKMPRRGKPPTVLFEIPREGGVELPRFRIRASADIVVAGLEQLALQN